jgi:hypothetical protein
MSDETERAREIDEAVKAADRKKADAARADAEAEVHNGEKIDNLLKCLDAIGKRLDAWEAKSKADDDDVETAKSEPSSSVNPLNDDPDKPLRSAPMR